MLQQFTTLLAFTFSFFGVSRSARSNNEGSSSLPWACSEPCPYAVLLSSVPTSLAPGMGFTEDKFSIDQGLGGWFRDGSSTIHLLCAHYFYYYCINFTSDRKDIRSWRLQGPCSLGHQEYVRESFSKPYGPPLSDILPGCFDPFLVAPGCWLIS